MIEMSMAGRDYQVMAGVLDFGQLFRDTVGVVVVDQGDGADNDRIRCSGSLDHQSIADEVAKCFGSVGIATTGNRAIEPLEKIGIEGYTDSAEFAHGCSCDSDSLPMGKLQGSTMLKIMLRGDGWERLARETGNLLGFSKATPLR
jgi:hypothetical protein